MKKLLFFLIFIVNSFRLEANLIDETQNYFRTDSAYVYTWDVVSKNWVLNSFKKYYYGINNLLDSVYEKSIGTNVNISRTINSFNEKRLITMSINYLWDGTWVPSSKYLTTYDVENKYSEVIVQIWNSNNWINTRLDKYSKYNFDGTISELQIYDWNNNKWIYHVTDFWSYDEEGHLIKREALLADNSIYYQILYEYDNNGLRIKMYAQFASGDRWINSWLQEYKYDDCSMQKSVIQYTGIGSEWLLQSKTVLFSTLKLTQFPDKKVHVCHNGHTIFISVNALKAHLRHGDCVGECSVEKNPVRQDCVEKNKIQKPPFTLYPNPAREKTTIKFDNDNSKDSKRIKLTDFYGNHINTFNIKDNSDLTIFRNNLPSGKYYISLEGKNVSSMVLIFE